MKKDVLVQVRFSDLDGYAHVNNAAYLTYLEIARVNVFDTIFTTAMENKIWFVLSESHVNYKIPILFTDTVYVKIWMSEAIGAKFTAEYQIHDGNGRIFATAKTVHAMIDGITKRPLRLTDDLKSLLHKEI